MHDHLPISLERTASIRARVDRGEGLDAILAAENLTQEIFLRAQRGWLARIGAETRRKRHALGQRYQTSYLAERPDLLPGPVTPPEDVDATGIGIVLDLGAVLPFTTERSPRTPPDYAPERDALDEPGARHEPSPEGSDGVEHGAARALRESVDETGFLDPRKLDLAALPFASDTEEPRGGSREAAIHPAAFSAVESDARPLGERPLGSTDRASIAVVSEDAHAPPQAAEPPPAIEGTGASVDQTAFVTSIAIEDPLPFRGQVEAPRSAVDEIAAEAADLAGATAFVPALSDADLEPQGEPTLPLERYASLLVDLDRAPRRAETLGRYGLDEPRFRAEQSRWGSRLADPGTAKRLREAMDQYRRWLSRH